MFCDSYKTGSIAQTLRCLAFVCDANPIDLRLYHVNLIVITAVVIKFHRSITRGSKQNTALSIKAIAKQRSIKRRHLGLLLLSPLFAATLLVVLVLLQANDTRKHENDTSTDKSTPQTTIKTASNQPTIKQQQQQTKQSKPNNRR
jgi:hypothetical protein